MYTVVRKSMDSKNFRENSSKSKRNISLRLSSVNEKDESTQEYNKFNRLKSNPYLIELTPKKLQKKESNKLCYSTPFLKAKEQLNNFKAGSIQNAMVLENQNVPSSISEIDCEDFNERIKLSDNFDGVDLYGRVRNSNPNNNFEKKLTHDEMILLKMQRHSKNDQVKKLPEPLAKSMWKFTNTVKSKSVSCCIEKINTATEKNNISLKKKIDKKLAISLLESSNSLRKQETLLKSETFREKISKTFRDIDFNSFDKDNNTRKLILQKKIDKIKTSSFSERLADDKIKQRKINAYKKNLYPKNNDEFFVIQSLNLDTTDGECSTKRENDYFNDTMNFMKHKKATKKNTFNPKIFDSNTIEKNKQFLSKNTLKIQKHNITPQSENLNESIVINQESDLSKNININLNKKSNNETTISTKDYRIAKMRNILFGFTKIQKESHYSDEHKNCEEVSNQNLGNFKKIDDEIEQKHELNSKCFDDNFLKQVTFSEYGARNLGKREIMMKGHDQKIIQNKIGDIKVIEKIYKELHELDQKQMRNEDNINNTMAVGQNKELNIFALKHDKPKIMNGGFVIPKKLNYTKVPFYYYYICVF